MNRLQELVLKQQERLKVKKIIDVEVAGTLSSLISYIELYKINYLIITGYLNGSDIRFIRHAISYTPDEYLYSPPDGKLLFLDLENATIVDGGEPYLQITHCCSNDIEETISYKTSANTISKYMFSSTSLEYIKLPRNTTSIECNAFESCEELKHITIFDNVTLIDSNAFSFCRKLIRLIIPEKTSFIGSGALWCCDSLRYVICRNPIPPKVGEGSDDKRHLFEWDLFDSEFSLSQTERMGVLLVPPGTSLIYKDSAPWGNFNKIEEYSK